MRESRIERKTGETDIRLSLSLDGSGRYSIASGIGFLNQFAAVRCGLCSRFERKELALHRAE